MTFKSRSRSALRLITHRDPSAGSKGHCYERMRIAEQHGIVEKYFGNPEVLLSFMKKTRKPVFHKSNIFFRDVQYALRDYFDRVENKPITTPEAERMARDVVELYSRQGVLRKVNNESYLLDMPEFATPKSGTYSMLKFDGGSVADEVEETKIETLPEPSAPAIVSSQVNEEKAAPKTIAPPPWAKKS